MLPIHVLQNDTEVLRKRWTSALKQVLKRFDIPWQWGDQLLIVHVELVHYDDGEGERRLRRLCRYLLKSPWEEVPEDHLETLTIRQIHELASFHGNQRDRRCAGYGFLASRPTPALKQMLAAKD